MSLKTRLSLFFLGFFIVIVAVVFYLIYQSKKADHFNGFYNEREVRDFVLTDQNGEKVSLSEFNGKLVLLNFGYTSCPDICPTTLTRLRNVYNQLESNQDEIQVLFISVDPDRDSTEKLKSYIPYFHKDFIGLTGSDEELSQVADNFNIVYFKEDSDANADYLMSHPTSVYLINRDGKLILKYPHNSKPEYLVQDIKKLL